MKTTAKFIAGLIALGGTALASTLNINLAVDTSMNFEGTALDSSFSVAGGWYDISNGLDYDDIVANFVTAGSVAFPYAGNPVYNGFASGDTAFFNANTLGIEGDNIFWFVTDGSSAYALLEDTSAQFVLESATPNTNATSLNSGTLGSFTQHVTAPGSNATSIGLVAIPEPSIALLGSLGILGLVRRRRH